MYIFLDTHTCIYTYIQLEDSWRKDFSRQKVYTPKVLIGFKNERDKINNPKMPNTTTACATSINIILLIIIKSGIIFSVTIHRLLHERILLFIIIMVGTLDEFQTAYRPLCFGASNRKAIYSILY